MSQNHQNRQGQAHQNPDPRIHDHLQYHRSLPNQTVMNFPQKNLKMKNAKNGNEWSEELRAPVTDRDDHDLEALDRKNQNGLLRQNENQDQTQNCHREKIR